MRRFVFGFLVVAFLGSGVWWWVVAGQVDSVVVSGAPPYGEPESAVPEPAPENWWQSWVRPAGSARVGLQVGHWKNEELPEELSRLIGNTGSSGGGKTEVEVNMAVVSRMAQVLEEEGVKVDVLPATVPKRYWADVFVAIHADGSLDPEVSGYKIAGPWRDMSGSSEYLVGLLRQEYEKVVELDWDPNITRNMRGYYAFSWWRYEHAVHPMTTAVIVETGFLTNPVDMQTIVDRSDVVAGALASGILRYLIDMGLV
jgi:hypothetical protein